MIDFTYKQYSSLCNELIKSGFTIMTVKEYLSSPLKEKYAILRHDVDSRPLRSLKMAQLEQSMGVTSTYYFRHTKDVFIPQIIKEVADLGHEIGFHYEVLSKSKGDYTRAIALFEKELADFKEIGEISTICMHGSPLSPYDNRDLWKKYDFRDFGIMGDAYLSMDAHQYYASDSGWRWDKKYKVRDLMPGQAEFEVKTTEDIILAIRECRIPSLYLLTHPGNWASNRSEWIVAWGRNLVGNTVKSLVMWRRSF
jgi:hypothetical protein